MTTKLLTVESIAECPLALSITNKQNNEYEESVNKQNFSALANLHSTMNED